MSPSDSFSLPSAGGRVSLLNDSKARTKRQHLRHSGSPSPNDDAFLSVTQPHGRGSGSSTSASNSPSPFGSNPSAGESGSNGSSTSVTIPSTDSSRDDSFDRGKLQAETRQNSDEERLGSNASSIPVEAQLRQLPRRTDTAYSSSPSLDDERSPNESPPNESSSTDSKLSPLDNTDSRVGNKRRRQTDTRADKTVQSRGVSMQKMLDSSRIARSPVRMLDDEDVEDEENGREDADDEEEDDLDADKTAQDVPMNMHRATAQKHGGFGGKTQMQKSDDNRAQSEYDAAASLSRERSSVGSATSSAATKETTPLPGRKAGSGSQIVGGKKRYPCSFRGCDKTFSTSGHAARHNRIHTGSKPYRCTFPGCHASFSRQDNSLQHYRTHVLHPKSRAGGAVSLEASQSDHSVAVDSELTHLDPETVATVQMGRKALEEGTAIAVVQEFIDGHGRRAEAVQRMVGQPKSGRRSSTTTQPDLSSITRPTMQTHAAVASSSEAVWQGHGAEQTHRRHASASGRPSVSDRQLGWNSHVDMRTGQPYPSPPHTHAAWERGVAYAHPAYVDGSPPPPPPPPQYGHGYMHAQGHPAHAYYPPHDSQPKQQPYFDHSPPHSFDGGAYMHGRAVHEAQYHAHNAPAPPPVYGGPPSDMAGFARRRSYAPVAHPGQGPTQSPYHDDARVPMPAPTVDFRERRRSDNFGMPSGAALVGPLSYGERQQVSQAHGHHVAASLPPPTAPPPTDAPYSKHRRSASAVAHVSTRGEAPPYDEHGRPLTSQSTTDHRSPVDAPSPSMSVRSYRSDGPYAAPVPRDDRSSALSLLSNTAARSGSAATKAQLPSASLMPGRARASTKGDMHLTLPPPGPPPALSKVPYSSDRSTNGLTPTPLPLVAPAAPVACNDRRHHTSRGVARAV